MIPSTSEFVRAERNPDRDGKTLVVIRTRIGQTDTLFAFAPDEALRMCIEVLEQVYDGEVR